MIDNNRGRNGPLWPTVIEAGFVELYGRDAQGRVNLDRGYGIVGDATRGGALSDGVYALTGGIRPRHSNPEPQRSSPGSYWP